MSNNKLPTLGELERSISQRIQGLYRRQFGHQPSKVITHMFSNKLTVIVENSLTAVERLLTQTNKLELANEVRLNIDDALKPLVIELIEEIMKVKVVNLLWDTIMDTGYTGMIAILNDFPRIRNPQSLPKGNYKGT